MDSSPPTDRGDGELLTFAREILDVQVHPWQEQLLERLERNPRPRFAFMGTPYGRGHAWLRQAFDPDWRARVERIRFLLGPGDPRVYRDRTVKRGPARVLPFRRPER